MAENLKVAAPQKLDAQSFGAFVRNLNERLARIAERFDKHQSALVLKGDLDAAGFRIKNLGTPQRDDDAVSGTHLQSTLDDLNSDDTTSDVADTEGGGGKNQTSKGKGATDDEIIATIADAVPTGAPPKIADTGAVGTTADPPVFALSDHTHQGVNLDDPQTVTGLKTFSRSTNPPFAVNAGAAKVTNLDADLLDGLDSLAFQLAAFGALFATRKNSAGSTFTRHRFNFIEGANVTITMVDDAVSDEVDITIAATGGGGGSITPTTFNSFDLGIKRRREITILDGAVTATSVIFATARPIDDPTSDVFSATAVNMTTGGFTLIVESLEGPFDFSNTITFSYFVL